MILGSVHHTTVTFSPNKSAHPSPFSREGRFGRDLFTTTSPEDNLMNGNEGVRNCNSSAG